ncbi:MAG: cytochrome c biogenesis CcdA family protein, partial [Chloroflexota bacterium]
QAAGALRRVDGRVVRVCLLFVAGFTLVFTALGATASTIGAAISSVRPLLEKLAGIFIIVMALVMVGLVNVPALQGEYRLHPRQRRGGAIGGLILGGAFAIGWTPCIGPVLAAVLAVAGSQARAGQGALLLLVYSMGLGLPFLVAGLYLSRLTGTLKAIRRILPAFTYAGAGILCLMGILLLSDRWLQVMAPFLRLYANLNWPPF